MPSLGHRANVTRVRTQKAIVETAFFVDESLYKHIEHVFPRDTRRQVAIFALTLINQMQVVYEQESLGGLVSITLTYLEIMYPQAQVNLMALLAESILNYDLVVSRRILVVKTFSSKKVPLFLFTLNFFNHLVTCTLCQTQIPKHIFTLGRCPVLLITV